MTLTRTAGRIPALEREKNPAVRDGDFPRDNWTWTMIVWGFLFAICFAALLYASLTKKVVISDAGGSARATDEVTGIRGTGFIPLLRNTASDRVIRIPLPEKIGAEDVTVENLYLDRILHIRIRYAQDDFFQQNEISGDLSMLRDVRCVSGAKAVDMSFEMSALYEYRTMINGHVMEISVTSPREAYDFRVILDPAEDNEIALAVSRKAAELAAAEGIRIYLTRTDTHAQDPEERKALLSETGADLYIRVDVSRSADPSVYGIRAAYNSRYFMPDYGNVRLSESLVRCLALSADDRGLSIEQAEPGSILWDLELVSAEAYLGFVSNPQELALLENEDYQDKLAAGIAAAVKEAAEELAK